VTTSSLAPSLKAGCVTSPHSISSTLTDISFTPLHRLTQVIVSFIWAWFSFLAVGVLPLYEGVPLISLISRGVYRRLRGLPPPGDSSVDAPARPGKEDGEGEKETQSGSATPGEVEYTGPGSANRTLTSEVSSRDEKNIG
jgi:hypothetical protein